LLTVDFERLHAVSGDSLLDLGCGAGRHTYAALERGLDVVAADLDDAVLKDVLSFGRAVADESAGRPAIACVNANALDLPFSDASFERIIASEVFEHIPDDGPAMSELARVLKPGGTAAVTVPRFWPEVVCWGLSSEYHANEGGHIRIYRRRQLVQRLRRAGLEVYASHHEHALHAPYWWLKCAVGVRDDEARLPSAYHRFLVWDMQRGHPLVRASETALNPVIGKSLVLYLRKA
jgi:SAM-dependent methyltransferase